LKHESEKKKRTGIDGALSEHTSFHEWPRSSKHTPGNDAVKRAALVVQFLSVRHRPLLSRAECTKTKEHVNRNIIRY
jgi:hypothetical protein